MPRIRHLKARFFTDAKLGALPPLARLFFQGLWVHADREGRLDDNALELEVQIIPYDRGGQWTGAKILAALESNGLIDRYEIDGRRFIQVRNFLKHQRPANSENSSEIPPCPEKRRRKTSDDGEKSLVWEKGKGEGKGDGDGKEDSAKPAAGAANFPPPFLIFQTNGPQKEWPLHPDKVREWQATYPGVNVTAEARKARQWLIDNPGKRKTARGMASFLGRWIARVQDSPQAMSVDVKGPKCASCGFHGVSGGQQVCNGCSFCAVCGVGAARAKMYTKRRADGTVSVRCLEHTKSGGKHG